MSRRPAFAFTFLFLLILTHPAPTGEVEQTFLSVPAPTGMSVPPNKQPKQEVALFDNLALRNIGPANMGGRIVSLAVVESNPATMYVATASGGLWKTTDNGDSWAPIFDQTSTNVIGDVAVSASNPDVVWVGTGENNARNSVSWGDGMYKSTDGGKTWRHMGLKETHHIGRVVIHPKNPDIVYVAALGHLWGPNKERGLYKTTDGGKTWEHSLVLDEETGCIDVAIDPEMPEILYTAAYRVRRDGFSGGNPAVQFGPKAGMYKTGDGGKTWERMAGGMPGPSIGTEVGRCGIGIYRKDSKIVYAVVQTNKTNIATIAGQAANMKVDPGAGGVFRSEDRGITWKQVNSLAPRPFYYGQIRVDPNDERRVYVLGIQFHISSDGGRTLSTLAKEKGAPAGPHPDHHALWIDPKDSSHLVLGNDGGLYFSATRGASWKAVRNLPIAQFYQLAVDMRRPYRVYGGLQDNGTWGGPSATRRPEGILLADWYRVAAADGFYCQVDPNDPFTVYSEAQYGRPVRTDLRVKSSKPIQPKAAKGTPAYRFNWNTPMLLSPHNSKQLYLGGNHLFRSDNRGDTWAVISPDLTHGPPGSSKSTGHTLTAIAESPLKPGLIYVGSDDGRVHVTQDGGKTWTDLSAKIPGVPLERWITRLECSHFDEGTAFLAIGRHRNDDRKPYLFKTTDFGATWTNLTNDMPPDAPLHVIRESSKNKDLLFAGSEFALLASLDGGKSWQRLQRKVGLPPVAVHDVVIHPRERELVIGTHGRGVYIMDIAPLEELNEKVRESDCHLFNIRPAHAFQPLAPDPPGRKSYVGANPPYGTTIYYYLKSAKYRNVAVTITQGDKEIVTQPGATDAGIQRVHWNLKAADGSAVAAGEYMVILHVDGERKMAKKLRVEAE